MNGISQLFKGIIIGIVLLLAIIGLLNISGKNESKPQSQQPTNIPAPSISIHKPSNAPGQTLTPDSSNQTEGAVGTAFGTLSTDLSSDKADPLVENTKETFKPEIIEQPITYGTLNLSAKQSGNNASQKVDFFIYDEGNKQVATSKGTENASFQLPTGQYKVVTRLGEQKKTTTVLIQKSRTSSEVFAMQAPISTGIVQVSAFSGNDKKPIRTRFIIEDIDGKIVAQRQQVSSTLFKLEAGTYIISAKNDDLSEARTVIVEAGSSSQEIFSLEKSASPGKVLLNAREEGTNKSIDVDLLILSEDGKPVKRFKSVSRAEVSLKAGNYLVRATGPNGQSSRKISLGAGQSLSETFRFKRPQKQANDVIEQPSTDVAATSATATTATATTTSNDIPPTEPQSVPVGETAPEIIAQGILKLSAVSATDRAPVKSNFYVQTRNGKHIDKKTYTDAASFKLDQGTYKITIKSKDMKTVTKMITLDADSKLNRIFALQSLVAPSKTPPSRPVVSEPIYRDTPKVATRSSNAPIYSDPEPAASPATGSLIIEMQPAKNLKTSPNTLLSNFLIKTRSGKKIAHIKKVQQATVKLDVGEYVVTASLRGQKKSKRFRVNKRQATKVSFRTSDFRSRDSQTQAALQKGILRSRIIDSQGRPLKGNLSVSNRSGKVVRRANNVSMAEFELPAKPFTVNIRYQGLSGSERVNIIAGETTVQTFTIASSPARQPTHRSRNNGSSSKEIRDALKEKLKEELRRIVR